MTNWWNKLNLFPYLIEAGTQEFALLGAPFGVFMHWVQFRGRSGERKGYYEICADWDPETRRRIPNLSCPICRDFVDGAPESVSPNNPMRGFYRYYFNALRCSRVTNNPDLTDLGTVWVNNLQLENISDLAAALDVRWMYDYTPNIFNTIIRITDPRARPFAARVGFDFGMEYKVKDKPDGVLIRFKGYGRFNANKPLDRLLVDFEEVFDPKGADQIEDELIRLGCYDELRSTANVVTPFTTNAAAWAEVEKLTAAREIDRLEKAGVLISVRAKARLLGVEIETYNEVTDTKPEYNAADDARLRAARIMLPPDED